LQDIRTQSQIERQIYEHTNKKLKFDSYSSHSLVFSRSGASAKESISRVIMKEHSPRLWNVVSQTNERLHKRMASSKEGSQTSGAGSILNQFITEEQSEGGVSSIERAEEEKKDMGDVFKKHETLQLRSGCR